MHLCCITSLLETCIVKTAAQVLLQLLGVTCMLSLRLHTSCRTLDMTQMFLIHKSVDTHRLDVPGSVIHACCLCALGVHKCFCKHQRCVVQLHAAVHKRCFARKILHPPQLWLVQLRLTEPLQTRMVQSLQGHWLPETKRGFAQLQIMQVSH